MNSNQIQLKSVLCQIMLGIYVNKVFFISYMTTF